MLLKIRSRGKAVKDLQQSLKDLELYADKVDGIFGRITLRAVKAFQELNGLLVDGIAGPQTLGALEIVKNRKKPGPIEGRDIIKTPKGMMKRFEAFVDVMVNIDWVEGEEFGIGVET